MQRVVYFAVLAGLLLGYYEFLGPGPGPSELIEDLEWWRPAGYVHTWEFLAPLQKLADDGFPGAWIPVGIFWLPALAMLVWGFRLFRSAVLRTLCTTGFFLLMIFPYYGYVADRVWRFFEWRSPAVAAAFAAVTATGLLAPSLLRAALRISRVGTGIVLALVFAAVFVLTTEVTGTDVWMRFNISPWPVVTLFGLLLLGSAIASFHVAAGAGSWIGARLGARGIGGPSGMALGALAAGVVAAALARISLQTPSPATLGIFAVVGTGYALARLWRAPADADEAARGGLVVLAAGAFALFSIHASDRAAAGFQRNARNVTATRLLVALEDHREKTGSYPRRLDGLVPDFFAEVPRPGIGLIVNEDDEFTYRNLGDSFVLEFSSVQWVQCGYSPPFDVAKYDEADYEDDEEDEDDYVEVEKPVDPELKLALADAGLEGSWNCEDAPPKLW